MAAGVLACIGLLGACGSDDAEQSYCQAGDDLRSSISGLTDVNIVSDGTSALGEQVDSIESDINALRESGADAASDEIDALDDAVEQLDTVLGDLGSEVSADGAKAAIEAVGSVTGAAGDVIDKLSTACE